MAGKGREAALTKARKELRESLLSIAPIFAEKAYFMSSEFSLVDCCFAPILWRLPEMDIKLPERSTKAMQKYMKVLFERDAFTASLSEIEMDMRD